MTAIGPSLAKASLPVVCPDYDDDCLDMTFEEALECYDGFTGNEHLAEMGEFTIGRACGKCPILSRLN